MPRQAGDDFYARLEPLFAACQLVLVEGHVDGAGPKFEVWREAVGGPCLAAERADIRAVISDERPVVPVPCWPRSDLAQLADKLLAALR